MTSYAPIRVSTLRGDQKIPFNTYVLIAGKYILLCREGDSFEGPRLEKLKSKKIAKMYVPAEQKGAYEAYMRNNLEQAYGGSQDKPIEMRTQIIHGALQAAAEDLIEEPDAKEYYSVALDAARRFIKFFFAEPLALQCIVNFKNTDFNIAHHGVNVAALSLAICEALGLAESQPMVMESMLVGAMIHDIEHNYDNLGRTHRADLYSRGEKKIFDAHAPNGYTRIKELKHFDPLVRDIVHFHEEHIDGSGPLKKREKDLDPLILVVAAANVFDSYMTYEDLHPRDLLKKYLIERMGSVQLEPMKALQTAMKKREII